MKLSSVAFCAFPIFSSVRLSVSAKQLVLGNHLGPNQVFNYNGNGQFSYDSDLPGGTDWITYNMDVADFDSDGLDDVVINNRGSSNQPQQVVYGNGTVLDLIVPKDINSDLYRVITQVKIADMNGDGHLDIILLQYVNTYPCQLLLNDGFGGFSIQHLISGLPTFTYGSGHYDMCLFDIDSDGDLDAVEVFTGNEGGPIVLHLNDGTGKLVFHSFIVDVANRKSGMYRCVNGDFNSDGLMDFVVAGFLFVNNGDLTFTERTVGNFFYGSVTLAADDFDNDGDLDLLEDGGIPDRFIWRNNGNAEFTRDESALPNPSSGSMPRWGGAAVVDLNDDKWPDLIQYSNKVGAGYEAFVLMNDGTGQYPPENMIVIPGSSEFATYAHALVNFGTVDTSTPVTSKYSNLNVDFGYEDPILTANSASSFEFEFTSTIARTSIHAAILASEACTNDNSAIQVKDGMDTSKFVSSVVIGTSSAKITKNVEGDVNIIDKNAGSTILNYCLRADIYDDSNPTVSVGAKKVDLKLTIAYDTTGDFTIDSISTNEFTASDATAQATRSVGIQVFKDSCTGCEIVAGDTNDCFTSDVVAIGETLTLCLKGDAADVELAGVQSAIAEAGGFVSNIVAYQGDQTVGEDNFVTSTTIENGEVILETLLIPSYFDALDGGTSRSITISGTLLVRYISRVRHLSGDGRNLQVQTEPEKALFAIDIPLEDRDFPKISRGDEGNGAIGIESSMFAAIAGGALVLL